MAYKIVDNCVRCGLCEEVCKNQAIKPAEHVYYIDSSRCTECVGYYESSRCAQECPIEACIPDPEHVETREQLLEKWYRLHPGETPLVK